MSTAAPASGNSTAAILPRLQACALSRDEIARPSDTASFSELNKHRWFEQVHAHMAGAHEVLLLVACLHMEAICLRQCRISASSMHISVVLSGSRALPSIWSAVHGFEWAAMLVQ